MSVSRKLLFTLESFFPSHRAGTEVYVLNLCHYFKTKGWKVGVLIATTESKEDYEYENIPVYTFPIPLKPDPKELNGLIPPRGIEGFLKRVKEIQPDLVHFHSFGRAINGYHLRAVKELGIKTAFTPHLGSFFCIKGDVRLYGKENCDCRVDVKRCLSCLFQSRGNNKTISNLLSISFQQLHKLTTQHKKIAPAVFQVDHRKAELDRVKKYADIVFSIAPWIQEAFEINGITKAKLIPQGISPVFFNSSTIQQLNSRWLSGSTDKIHFAFIGRMHPSKGFHLLKEAWEQIDKSKAHLHVLTNPSGGETEYFDEHKKWASEKANITWNEALSQQEVVYYLNQVDVLILPSVSNEVAPLVILEAATRKIPVIGSDYIAIKSMINDGIDGLLFKNGDTEQLCSRIQKLINQPELINQFSNNIKTPHSMDAVAIIIEQEYLYILK
ncbi:glycosyltransferase [Carboxylicivirga caseinilyticus]|uniref:glycosyltransferase n=1 Tax=Carboxylicivirga caseinilyticus TaxID=3417572 RepID=UPI003D341E1C|nr:glycosyltransferase [Marinilabiliaceae bacterium A049]